MTVALRTTLLLPLTLLLLSPALLHAEESHVRAKLAHTWEEAVPGARVPIEVTFEIDPGWHIYWRNPGDAGTATEIEWKLPEGYTIDSLAWPLPHTIGEAPEVSYGYEERVTLKAFLRIPSTARANEEVELGARVKWLVCNEICIPGTQALSLRLPIRAKRTPVDVAHTFLVDEPPRPLKSDERVEVGGTDSLYTLRVNAPWVGGALSLEFYPYEEATIDHSAPQHVSRTGAPASNEATITVGRSTFASGRAERMRGVLVATAPTSIPNVSGPTTRFGVEIDIPVSYQK